MKARLIAARAAKRNWRIAAVAALASALLAACGQKGPLFLPGHSKDTPWPLREEKPPASATVNAPAAGNASAAGNAPAAAPAAASQGNAGGGSAPTVPATGDDQPAQEKP
jgi:predicted small lipoprotein YifL